MEALKNVVDNYPDIKIFNLSLNAKDNSNIHE
jgi:hypothetical protein